MSKLTPEHDFMLDKWLDPSLPLYNQILEYLNWCYSTRGMRIGTIRNKARSLKMFAAHSGITDIRDATNKMIDDWMASDRERGLRGATINDYYKHVRKFIVWMKDCDVAVPGVKVAMLSRTTEEPATRHFFFEDQVNQALAYADRREWLMIKIAFDCGLRLTELRTLRLSNFTAFLDGRYFHIVGKGRKERNCVMSIEARQRLNDYIERENITDWLWPNKNGTGPICESRMRECIEKPFRIAKLPCTPHDLRRSYATDCLVKGATHKEIQNGMGHSSIKITEIYLAQTYDESVVELYKKKFATTPENLR